MANHRNSKEPSTAKASAKARNAAGVFVCACLALSILSPHAIMAACVCAMICGAWCFVDGSWSWQPEDNPAAAVNISVVCFALGSAAICWLKGEPAGELEPYLSLLGAPLLGIGLRQLALHASFVGAAIACAAMAGAVAAVWQVAGAHEMQRASTQVAATSFGTLGAIYSVICASMTSWAAVGKATQRLLAAGTAAGVVVAILSGSRGAWVILLLVLPVAILCALPPGQRARSIVFLVALALVATAAAAMPNNPFSDRVRETVRIGDPLRASFSREAVKAFVSAPWSGIPREQFAAALDRAWLSVRPYAPHESPPRHSHNELLDAAAVRGAGGAILNVIVLAVPIAVLWRLRKTRQGCKPATTGLLFMAAFLLAGTTDLLLQLTSRRMTFLFVVLFCVIAATTQPRQESLRQSNLP